MSEPRGLRDLNRLRWVTIVLPIVFVWGFELVRFAVLDPNLTSDESHVASKAQATHVRAIALRLPTPWMERGLPRALARVAA